MTTRAPVVLINRHIFASTWHATYIFIKLASRRCLISSLALNPPFFAKKKLILVRQTRSWSRGRGRQAGAGEGAGSYWWLPPPQQPQHCPPPPTLCVAWTGLVRNITAYAASSLWSQKPSWGRAYLRIKVFWEISLDNAQSQRIAIIGPDTTTWLKAIWLLQTM